MKKKITFFSFTGATFLQDIVIDLRKDYDLHFFYSGTPEEFRIHLHNTDLAWFEFADRVSIEGTVPPKLAKYICRFHSYEMFTDMPKQINWEKIDKVIFVNPLVADYCSQKFPMIDPNKNKSLIIPNGINLKKFKIPNKTYSKKIAYVGFLNYKKGPDLLLQFFNEIYEQDPSFEFHIAGKHQDERIFLYMNHVLSQLPFKVHFDGWINDINAYLEDKDYIISSSLFESFQYSIAEGMACGCVPLIHNWPGSDLLYPKEYTFFSGKQCMDIIRQFELSPNQDEIRAKCRMHIANHYSFDHQIKAIRATIEDVLGD